MREGCEAEAAAFECTFWFVSVSKLLAIIIRCIEGATAGTDDLRLREAEMDRWCASHGFG